jgi:hypothetical protein
MMATKPSTSKLDHRLLLDCLDACLDCAQACTACADACLAEPMVKDLVTCIRTNLTCADVCDTTGRVLSRDIDDVAVARAMLQACAEACRACGAECAQHAEMHEHCGVCADACRRCEEACRQLLDAMV